jgi:tetratricopeptide (TPR) repeat protein
LNKQFTYHVLSVIIVALLLLTSKVGHAQWTLDVVGTVKKEETKKRFEGVTITIKKNGTVWKTLTSESSGKFNAGLEPDGIYLIEFSKPGHVTKRIEFSTKNVPEDDAKYGFEFPMEMNLFEKMDGLDVSILNKPIAKVAFDPATGYMDYDPAYTKSIKNELDRLKKELEEKLKQQEADRKAKQGGYDKAIAAADKLFNAEKWAEAKPFYDEAAKIFPNETYPLFQLGLISDKLAATAEADKRYNSAIAQADAGFKARDWDKATMNYQKAASYKPEEKYPADKLKEIKDILDNEKKVAKDYDEAILAGDQFFTLKEYEKAKAEYQKALALKSYEEYPKTKISDIDKIISESKQLEQEYTAAITEADNLFKAKDFDKSILSYQKAEKLKPTEEYPKKKIEEAKSQLAAQKKLEEDYKNFIAAADAAFNSKDYQAAQTSYQQAVAVKAAEQYPKDKIAEIKTILEDIAKKEAEEKQKEANYLAAISNGDKALGLEKYEVAIQAYEAAIKIKAEEQYPKDKIVEINTLLAEKTKKEAEEKAKNEQYQKLITEADGLLATKDYEKAKAKYQLASEVKTTEQYPKDKITEIDNLLADLASKEAAEKAKNEQYQALIAEADGLMGSKDYERAKAKYQSASQVKTEEKYPKDKVTEIDGLLAELAKKAAAEKAINEKYQQFITLADNNLGAKKYEEAKAAYNQALEVKSEEQYPKEKLKEIEATLAAIAKMKAEEEAAAKAEKEKEEKYNAFIVEADASLATKKYENAISSYKKAIEVKSSEQYPKDKIAEVENILAEIARKKAEEESALMAEKEREEKYNSLIAKADKSFASKDYEVAKTNYNEAVGLKASEQYPKDKIIEINALLAEIAKKKAEEEAAALALQGKEQQYLNLIAQADEAFNTKNYEDAKVKYYSASAIKKEEQYPKDKINEITKILAELALKKEEDKLAAEAEKKKREYYNAVIAQADGEFAAKNYEEAKRKYTEASAILPDESYPKTKIKEIENLLAQIAAEKENAAMAEKEREEKYNNLIVTADNNFNSKNYDEAKTNYNQALAVKPNQQYPKDKLLEIKIILDKLASEQEEIKVTNNAQQQKLDQYNALVEKADELFSKKKYNEALNQYNSASSIMPSEMYPKEQITKLNKLLAELAQSDKAKEQALLAEKQKRDNYNELIYEADRLFRFAKYQDSKYKYEQALALYNDEKYPREQLIEIEKRINEGKDETIIVSNNPNELRAKIDDSKEKEIEKRIADLLKNRDADKAIIIENEKNEQRLLEKDRTTLLEQKIKATRDQLIMFDKERNAKNETRDKYRVQNQEELDELTKQYKDAEKNLMSDSEVKRQDAKEEIILIENQIKQFNASKDEQLEDKVTELYTFADNVNETNLIISENATARRVVNKEELDEILLKIEEDVKKAEKRRKDREIDLRAYQKQIDEQNAILVTTSRNKRLQNRDSLVDLVAALHKQQLKSSKYYELNVAQLEEYRETLKNLEIRQSEAADTWREENIRDVEAYQANIKEKEAIQAKKYYEKTAYLEGYKQDVASVDKERIDKHREVMQLAKEVVIQEELTKLEMEKSKSQYHLRFAEQIEKERELNTQFTSDLQVISLNKIRAVNFDDVYQGEQHLSENLELADKYPQGITEETSEVGNAIVLRRIKVTGTHVDVYEKTFYKWGGTFYSKNGYNITDTLWDLESIEK